MEFQRRWVPDEVSAEFRRWADRFNPAAVPVARSAEFQRGADQFNPASAGHHGSSGTQSPLIGVFVPTSDRHRCAKPPVPITTPMLFTGADAGAIRRITTSRDFPGSWDGVATVSSTSRSGRTDPASPDDALRQSVPAVDDHATARLNRCVSVRMMPLI